MGLSITCARYRHPDPRRRKLMTTDPEGFERVMLTALGKANWHSLALNEHSDGVGWLDDIRRARRLSQPKLRLFPVTGSSQTSKTLDKRKFSRRIKQNKILDYSSPTLSLLRPNVF